MRKNCIILLCLLYMQKIFYVCSYGGSGSYMLCNALKQYGEIKHIHSRNPPNKLTYIGNDGGGDTYHEWFNGITIPEDKLKNYHVIFIYRNPSFSIPSRFEIPAHLEHIQCDSKIKLEDILTTNKDLYKIREFYDNYTKPNNERNYKIYCVKYEDIFNNQDKLSDLLEIGKLNLVNESTRKNNENLDKIYADLIDEMNKNNFIMIS